MTTFDSYATKYWCIHMRSERGVLEMMDISGKTAIVTGAACQARALVRPEGYDETLSYASLGFSVARHFEPPGRTLGHNVQAKFCCG